jgi:DNA polymerase
MQIEIIKPSIICPMGNFATSYVLKRYGMAEKIQGISKLHGKVIHVDNLFDKIDIIPLYHPAVATYNPYMKEILLKDIKVLEGYT